MDAFVPLCMPLPRKASAVGENPAITFLDRLVPVYRHRWCNRNVDSGLGTVALLSLGALSMPESIPSSGFCPDCLRRRRRVMVSFGTKRFSFFRCRYEMSVCSRCGYVFTPQFRMSPQTARIAQRQRDFRASLQSTLHRIKSKVSHSLLPIIRGA